MCIGRYAALIRCARMSLAVAVAASLIFIGLLTRAQAGDCSLDPTFGRQGKALSDFDSPVVSRAAVLQSDGKIVTAGHAIKSGKLIFAVARYNSNGSSDRTFGTGGLVSISFYDIFDYAMDVAIQADNKIVVAGVTNSGCQSCYDFALARYNSDGSLSRQTAAFPEVTDAIHILGSGRDVPE
jgi:uncharacterized delta-60 repeat protein